MSGESSQAKAENPAAAQTPKPETLQVDYTSTQNMTAVVAPPPQVDPLGITGDQIEDLSATIAPVGSEMQDKIKEIPEPSIDITSINIAPVGSDIGSKKKEDEPPPPDTNGMAVIEP